MDDSLTLARLTLMLLRASVSHPEALSVEYRVIMLPSNEMLSRDQALIKLAGMPGELEVAASTRDSDLVVTVHEPTHWDMERLAVAARMFREGIRSLNTRDEPDALVKAVGFRESILVPARVVEHWLQVVDCGACPMSLGRPDPHDPTSVVAVLYLGKGDGRSPG